MKYLDVEKQDNVYNDFFEVWRSVYHNVINDMDTVAGAVTNVNNVGNNITNVNSVTNSAGANQTFTVTVQDVSGNKYFIDSVQTPVLKLARGRTYTFNMDDSSNATHPFSIGTAANDTVYTSGITYFLDGVSKTYAQYTSGFAAAT